MSSGGVSFVSKGVMSSSEGTTPVGVKLNLLFGSVFSFSLLLIFLDKCHRSPNHVYRKGVSINLHGSFLIIELETTLFNGQLNLLLEHPALVGVMRGGLMPLAPLVVLELFS
jgi:hypothetical protein